jgi:hypothetical protein
MKSNIWGAFFSFFLPGIVCGMMAMACVYAALAKRRRNKR